MAAAHSRVYAGICRRDRLTSKECPFWFYSLFCGEGVRQESRCAKHVGIIFYRTRSELFRLCPFMDIVVFRLIIKPLVIIQCDQIW